MTPLRRRLPLAAALAGAALAAALPAALPAPADARSHTCPARSGTLAKKPLGRVWHKGLSLYACTTVYDHRPVARRMGPWKPGTKVAFDGVDVVWSVPLVRDGVRSDRMWAGNADDGSRWLRGTRIVPASGDQPARESRVRTLLMKDTGAAWLTTDGDVVFALGFPETDPEAIGTPTIALQPTQKLLLAGSYPDPAVQDAIAGTLAIDIGDGEGDECGGSNPYTFTFRTVPAGPQTGARWWGSWTSTNCR